MIEDDGVDRLQATVEELQTVNRVLERVCRVRETNHIMSLIIDELIRLTEADQGVINLVKREEGVSLETVVRKGEAESGGIPFRVSVAVSGWVLKNKRVLKLDDLDSDERFRGLSSEDGRFQSALCCPMTARGETIGITTLVRSRAKGPFQDRHARIAGVIASQSAHVLSTALLLDELARKNELLRVSQEKLRNENIRLRAEIGGSFAFENIVGKSPAMRKVMMLVSKVCSNDSPVLITGATGTGKELIARAIHFNSPRKDKPFVVKNCGVRTESLLESELFGHVKGAFTGADREKIGLFEEASGGSIFLDEIGDAPLSTQVAILRVLENGEIRPIGATKTRFVDVRVISATNKDLSKEIEKAAFRQDLLYRLNTLTIDVPPLCHRREDIPLLLNHFLRQLQIKLGKESLSLTPAALDIFVKYSWPGNVRQLEKEIERAAVVSDVDGQIDVSDLSLELIGAVEGNIDLGSYRGRLHEIVERVEKELISKALCANDGNILRTSQYLGVTRKGLKDKMLRYGITSNRED